MITVGTAGHIDHGKTAIVRRLTGTDPDRLPEEKARGMTIDLGFAFYKTVSGDDIAFVDVPGHERFVKNMIAGAGGIDAVLLVIAADDGWMPQSEEHFQIIRLLGIEHGSVVINKCDLVDAEWLDLLESDIRDKVSGTFLEKNPVLRISAETGAGFDALSHMLDKLPDDIPSHKETGKARLFIDRSFVRTGIGGVVTGTLRGGTLSVGQSVAVWPSSVVGRIRKLHSRGEEVKNVTSGQRTAISFTGVDKDLLVRGGIICERTDLDYFRMNPVMALHLEMTPKATVNISDRRRVLVIIGTTEIEGELRIFDREEMSPSQNGIVFFRPDNPVCALVGDHFIVRLPTPMITLGGGVVLDHFPRFPRRKELPRLEYLSERTDNSIESLLKSELHKHCVVKQDEILSASTFGQNEIVTAVKSEIESGSIAVIGEYLYEPDMMSKESDLLFHKITEKLAENSHLSGLSIESILSRTEWSAPAMSVIVEYLVAENRLARHAELISVVGREQSLSGAVEQAHSQIISKLKENPYSPPSLSELAKGGKNYQQAIKYIVETKEGYKCGSEFIFLRPVWIELVKFVREIIAKENELRPANLKERFGFTRKYAIPILEETDRIKLTRRDGDVRRQGERFGSEDSFS